MEKVTKADLDRGVKMVLEGGKTVKEAMAATGLNESQIWLHGQSVLLFAGILKPITGSSETALAAQIIRARQAQESWGLIAVRAQMPESRVRRIFKEAAQLDSRGLRTGKGGRFVAGDVRFYDGADRAKFGTELLPGKAIIDQVPADRDAAPKRKLPTLKPKAERKPRTPKAPKAETEAK